ncbi:MAG: DNA alkylation repair protein [Magnetococcales bacterium]|nr:DNA alkylation repair protein [Magnetococcales bacterium]
MTVAKIKAELASLGNVEIAAHSAKFFKTAKGQYGEGDRFIGVRVPVQRKVAQQYKTLPLNGIQELLRSAIHEHRLTAVIILVNRYQKAKSLKEKEKLFQFYLDYKAGINNWDLVDSSAHKIVGNYLLAHKEKRAILYHMADSTNIWDRRIAIIATMTFINNGEFTDTLNLSEKLIDDPHDLMQKAVGWALREVGKVDQKTLEKFLNKHAKTMPRTMLRYAIEKFTTERRKFYMQR